jgi:plasmid stabilization system protein ParE
MKSKVIWSSSALSDIRKIYDYIAVDSPDRGALFIERLIEATDKLESFHSLGRIIPELSNDKHRELIYGSYRIMYEITEDKVNIASVVHAARDW